MTDNIPDLTAAARQLLAVEELLGGTYIPAGRNPLPEVELPAEGAEKTDQSSAAVSALGRDERIEAFRKMDAEEVSVCTKCRLCETRTNTVFGEGDPEADLVFIGEAPGGDEDASGRPFVGRAGKLLTKMIEAMGLTREQVFICNVIKCRPPGNRNPQPDEVAACWDYLMRQLRVLQPKVIVTLGNPATQGLLQTRTGITRLRGTWQRLGDLADGHGGTAVMPTFHPSYVLRQYNHDTRSKVWSDLQQVMDLLGLERPSGGKG